MTFWDTVRGNELADVLIHNLPKLARRKQIIEHFDWKGDAIVFIEEQLKKGNLFVDMIEHDEKFSVIIETTAR